MKNIKLISALWRPTFLLVFIGFFQCRAAAQNCAILQAEYQTASAMTNKCGGYPELCNPSTPPKRYLQTQTIATGSGYYLEDAITSNAFFYSFMPQYYNSVQASIITVSGSGCSAITTRTGKASWSDTYAYSGPDSDGHINSGSGYDSGTAVEDTNGNWQEVDTNHVGSYGTVVSFLQGNATATNAQCTPVMQTTALTGSGMDTNGDSWSTKLTVTTWLSSEYSDAMLRGLTMARIPAYTTNWSATTQGAFGSAKYLFLDTNHITDTCGRMQYRFRLMTGVKDVVYRVKWDEITTFTNGTTASPVHMSEQITGNGDMVNGVLGTTHVVGVPLQECTITVSGWEKPEIINLGTGGS